MKDPGLGSGVGTVEPVEIGPVNWRHGDNFTLTVTLNVWLDGRHYNWPRVEGECHQILRQRLREAREALHQGRPR